MQTKPARGQENDRTFDRSEFRARLRSQSLPSDGTARVALRPSGLLPDAGSKKLLESTNQFHAAMKTFIEPQDDKVTRQLKSYASLKASTQLLEEILGRLRQTHNEIEAAIDEISEPASSLLSSSHALYSNIEHPLCATLCHTHAAPRATISGHCSAFYDELQIKVERLEQLKLEWVKCVQHEEEIWEELEEIQSGDIISATDGRLSPEILALQSEAKAIADLTEQDIDDIEADFSDAIKAETMKMISMMM